MRVKSITLEVCPDDSVWGFSELLDGMDGDERECVEAVIELVNEDFHGMFEDAVWRVEFEGRDANQKR